MTAAMVAPIIGVPYLRRGTTPEGWDCMGCARYARETIFGRPWRSLTPSYGDEASHVPAVRAAMIADHLADWTLLGDKRMHMRTGAVLLFQYFGAPSHVATAVSSREFVHCLGGAATVLVDFDREPQWERRLRGVYD